MQLHKRQTVSHHLWSPFADKKWVLITTLDDYSRMLVFADFFEEETTWSHLMALKSVVTTYEVGSNYYNLKLDQQL